MSETIRCSSSTVDSDKDSTSVLMRMAIVAWWVVMNSRIWESGVSGRWY